LLTDPFLSWLQQKSCLKKIRRAKTLVEFPVDIIDARSCPFSQQASFDRNRIGAVYTKREAVEAILDLIGYTTWCSANT